MNFLYGIPKVIRTLNDDTDEDSAVLFEKSLCLVKSPKDDLFLVSTFNSMHLYSVRPGVEICRTQRSKESIAHFGFNSKVVWRSDATAILLHTSKNFLLIFDLQKNSDAPLLQFNHNAESVTNSYGPGEAMGIPNYSLQLRSTLHAGRTLSAVTALKSSILLLSSEPDEWHELSWNGDLLPMSTGLLSSLPFLSYSKKGNAGTNSSQYSVNCLATSSDSRQFVWQNGHAQLYYVCAVSRRGGAGVGFVGCPFSFDSQKHSASYAQFAHKLPQLAVGDCAGDISLYKLPETPMESLHFEKKLKVSPPAGSLNKPTAVVSVEYSSDDTCIAVAWERSGLALWSATGSLIWSTCGEDIWVQSANLVSSNIDKFFGSISSVFWGPGDTELYVLPRQQTAPFDIYVLPVVKCVMSANPVYANINSGLLQADDRVMMPMYTADIYSVANTSSVHTRQVQVPNIYTGFNWPIRYVVVDESLQYLAVAGRFGVVTWSNASGKWRMFSIEAQERAFSCRGGMAWYQYWLLLACEDHWEHNGSEGAGNHNSSSFSIRAFNRKRALDLGSTALEVSVSSAVDVFQLAGDTVVCILSNKSLVIGRLGVRGPLQALEFSWVQSIDLNGAVGVPKTWFSAKFVIPLPKLPSCTFPPAYLLLCGTSLLLLRQQGEKSEPEWRMEPVAQGVDRICAFTHKTDFDHAASIYTSIWAIGGSRVRVWLNPTTKRAAKNAESCFATPLEEGGAVVIPVDSQPSQVSLQSGCVISLEQKVQIKSTLDVVWFKTQHRARLFVPNIVLYLLSIDQLEAAKLYCQQFRHLDYFDHILEVILHEAVEAEDEPGSQPLADLNLYKVFQFLESFPNRLEIIVRCARKSEVAIWPRFFHFAGDIKLLFKECLDSGYLETACSYLIILQTLENVEQSRPLARQLLQIAMSSNYRKVVSQVVRYLESIGDLALLNSED